MSIDTQSLTGNARALEAYAKGEGSPCLTLDSDGRFSVLEAQGWVPTPQCFTGLLDYSSETTCRVLKELVVLLQERSAQDQEIASIAANAISQLPDSSNMQQHTKLELVAMMHQRYALYYRFPSTPADYLSLFYSRKEEERHECLTQSVSELLALATTFPGIFSVKTLTARSEDVLYPAGERVSGEALLMDIYNHLAQALKLTNVDRSKDNPLKTALEGLNTSDDNQRILQNCFSILAGKPNFHMHSNPAKVLFSLVAFRLKLNQRIMLENKGAVEQYRIEWVIGNESSVICRLFVHLPSVNSHVPFNVTFVGEVKMYEETFPLTLCCEFTIDAKGFSEGKVFAYEYDKLPTDFQRSLWTTL